MNTDIYFFLIKVHPIFERLMLRDKWLIASCLGLFFQGSNGLPGVPGADGQKVSLPKNVDARAAVLITLVSVP